MKNWWVRQFIRSKIANLSNSDKSKRKVHLRNFSNRENYCDWYSKLHFSDSYRTLEGRPSMPFFQQAERARTRWYPLMTLKMQDFNRQEAFVAWKPSKTCKPASSIAFCIFQWKNRVPKKRSWASAAVCLCHACWNDILSSNSSKVLFEHFFWKITCTVNSYEARRIRLLFYGMPRPPRTAKLEQEMQKNKSAQRR